MRAISSGVITPAVIDDAALAGGTPGNVPADVVNTAHEAAITALPRARRDCGTTAGKEVEEVYIGESEFVRGMRCCTRRDHPYVGDTSRAVQSSHRAHCIVTAAGLPGSVGLFALLLNEAESMAMLRFTLTTKVVAIT
jgi:hypothetical protein